MLREERGKKRAVFKLNFEANFDITDWEINKKQLIIYDDDEIQVEADDSLKITK